MSTPTTPKRSLATTSTTTSSSSRNTIATPSTPSNFTLIQDLDDPTSTPSSYKTGLVSNVGASGVGAGGAGGGGDDSADEDEAPDYLRLLSKTSSSSSSSITIPKRGEKDFEPTGFGGQSKLLQQSREAMYTAVSGERKIGSRSLVRAVWDGKRARARLLDVQGKIFETVGVVSREKVEGKMRVWNELLPEEALFLAERGSLQIYSSLGSEETSAEGKEKGKLEDDDLVPMSLQQAFATLMLPATTGEAEDEPLTREAYLIYAYLKRLGYVVQRAKIIDAIRAAPISANALARKNQSQSDVQVQGVVADPERPIQLVTIWDALLYIPRRLAQLAGDAAKAMVRWIHLVYRKTIGRLVAIVASNATKLIGGARQARVGANSVGFNLGLETSIGSQQDGRRFLGDKGNVKWDSYDAIFSSLQIIPSGHDFHLPSSSFSSSSSPSSSTIIRQPSQSQSNTSHLKPFYYAYRPATSYRKSHPPPPEFRIIILNSRITPLPSIYQFESIFAQIPIPGSDAELFSSLPSSFSTEGSMTEQEVKERVEYEKQLKASNEAKNRAAYGKFSDGKQKFLREKAAVRQAQIEERKLKQKANLSWWRRWCESSKVGRGVWKLVILDWEVLRRVGRVFRHCPGCFWVEKTGWQGKGGKGGKGGSKPLGAKGRGGGGGGGGGGNVFPPLKAGRRSVVVAVVDGSITTLLRFGESEFANWALYGNITQPHSQVLQGQESKRLSSTG